MLSEAEKKSLVSFVIVGGGATSCEFTTELSDFVRDDVSRWYPELAKLAKLTVVEAGPRLMGSFDATVVEYYDKFLKARGVDVRTNTPVKAVEKSAVEGGSSVALLGADERLEFGCLVWSAGLAPVKFTSNSTNFIKGPGGRIVVDEYLRVVGPGGGVHSRAFALGDCAIDPAKPLPPTASAAEQQGSYLAEAFNSSYYAVGTDRATPLPTPPPIFPSAMPIGGLEVMNRLFTPTSHFRYIERGAMASMGRGCVII
jgi:NADH dehydrogenase FAD-containing subunit